MVDTKTTPKAGPQFSPLEPVFSPYGAEVPDAFQVQFLHSAGDAEGVELQGKMHWVWHKGILHPLFMLLGYVGILVPYRGRNISCVFQVVPGYFADGKPYQRWNRTLYFRKPVHFNTTILYDQTLGLIGDLVGPRDMIYIAWRAAFHPPSRFTLDTAACALKIGNRFFWLPEWLWPLMFGVVRFIQEVDGEYRDIVHIDLLLTHPWFGAIFGYTGTFRVIKVQAGGAGTWDA